MDSPVIEIDDLGIFFKIYHRKGLSKREAFVSYGKDLLGRMIRPGRAQSGPEVFWALRNVSFAVGRGEVVGVIGENGSGKSTLLKTLAGNFRPDEGRVSAQGKVGALLELGAGFHPELTGRENVYLNGSILGMKRRQIDRIYDEIVGFSELGEFIDTPIKSYSSGMKVRLGFSVAIHLNPDILLVDEVLAVGDMAFRMKCLEKMSEFKNRGVTILFVSHDLTTVRGFCEKVVLLGRGELLEYGPPGDVTNRYFKMVIEGRQRTAANTPEDRGAGPGGEHAGGGRVSSIFSDTEAFRRRASFNRIQNGKASFANIQLLDEFEHEIGSVEYEQEVILRMAVEIHEDVPRLGYGYHIRDKNGMDILYSDSLIEGRTLENPRKGQRFIIDWRFRLSLMQGNYNILCVLTELAEHSATAGRFCDLVPVACQFTASPRIEGSLYGAVHIDNTITITPVGR
jgi:lipopolysaccharide transport system ATP-binding protein